MNIPEDLRYTATHEWVREEQDGTLVVGVTDTAQDAQGEVVFVGLPEVGRSLAAGEPCVVVESAKAASDVCAPIAGEVIAVNTSLADTPGDVNSDPYGAWLFRVRPASGADAQKLLDAAAYRASCG